MATIEKRETSKYVRRDLHFQSLCENVCWLCFCTGNRFVFVRKWIVARVRARFHAIKFSDEEWSSFEFWFVLCICFFCLCVCVYVCVRMYVLGVCMCV